MSQPVRIQTMIRYAVFFALIFGTGAGLYFLLDHFVVNPNLAPSTLDIATKSVQFENAPDFELADLDGNSHRLSDFKDKIVILNFWASWCPPCIEEFPSLYKLIQTFQGNVVLVAVSQDKNFDDIKDFAKKFNVQFSSSLYFLWDGEGKIGRTYRVEKLPDSFILTKNNKFYKKISGLRDWLSITSMTEFKNLVDSSRP
ncbi:MAG: TlpA disulfide reductase family protein [Bdellovibrionales bacterium]